MTLRMLDFYLDSTMVLHSDLQKWDLMLANRLGIQWKTRLEVLSAKELIHQKVKQWSYKSD